MLNLFEIHKNNLPGEWEKAFALCSKYEINDDGINLLVDRGKTLEQMGKLLEAEKLYLTIRQPDLAISMYKTNRQYEQVNTSFLLQEKKIKIIIN